MSRLLFAKGARGALVKKIQKGLGFMGHDIDGDYGNQTRDAVQRFQGGAAASGEVDTDTWGAITQLPVPAIEERALALTADFEGHGFELAQGNFDGAGITWGIIGFTLQGGELGEIVREVQASRPDLVTLAFGDLTPKLLQVIDQPFAQQLLFADSLSILPGKARLAEPWRSSFGVFGSLPEVQAVQLQHAHKRYFVPALASAGKLNLKTELGVALAFDIHVQNGPLSAATIARFPGGAFAAERDLRVALANAVADSAKAAFREDVRSRKMAIATGEGVVHGASFALKSWGLDEIVV